MYVGRSFMGGISRELGVGSGSGHRSPFPFFLSFLFFLLELYFGSGPPMSIS